jgi:acyl carrier protein
MESNLAAGGRADIEAEARIASQIRRRLGFAPMPPERGLELLDAAAEMAEPLLALVRFDSAALRARAEAGTLAPMLRGLVRAPARRQSEPASLVGRLASTPEGERGDLLLDLVRSQAAAVLGHASASEVEPGKAFQELGFDSLAAVELRNRLGAATGLRLSPTLVFDYPSATSLAGHLLAEIDSGAARSELSEEAAFREALALIPIARLREAGLMQPLRELLDLHGGEAEVAEGDPVEEIDSMDIDDLVRQTLEGRSDAAEDGGLG